MSCDRGPSDTGGGGGGMEVVGGGCGGGGGCVGKGDTEAGSIIIEAIGDGGSSVFSMMSDYGDAAAG